MEPFFIVAGSESRLSSSRGFTIVELMVTVAVLAILLALAAPSFIPIMERWRVRQAAEGLRSTLYYARSEAIRRGGNVIVEKLDGNNDCTADDDGDWSCGWVITSSGEILQRFHTAPNISVIASDGKDNISFDRWGMTDQHTPSSLEVDFNLYPRNKTSGDPAATCLRVLAGGHIKLTASSSC
jgi:type IV fimbrial biogenesis protein FimT